jgi:ABC-type sugar transport system ATPase subunit
VVVLDEATAYLGSESEAAIQWALAIELGGQTLLAIAHRLSTVGAADQILVIDSGQIAEGSGARPDPRSAASLRSAVAPTRAYGAAVIPRTRDPPSGSQNLALYDAKV